MYNNKNPKINESDPKNKLDSNSGLINCIFVFLRVVYVNHGLKCRLQRKKTTTQTKDLLADQTVYQCSSL